MWDYKVVAGTYSLDGGEVVVENPLGRGTLQRILDHYGGEGFELVSSHYDALNREIVVLLKKPKGGAVAATMTTPMAAAASAPQPTASAGRSRAGRSRGGGRRSKEELDRLYRDT